MRSEKDEDAYGFSLRAIASDVFERQSASTGKLGKRKHVMAGRGSVLRWATDFFLEDSGRAGPWI
jgi:hypothetical protein